jgi:hypothetical protein
MIDISYQPVIDPMIPSHAYFIGFVMGDGHMRINNSLGCHKSRIQIEIDRRDIKILESFESIFPEATIGKRNRTVIVNGRTYTRDYCKFSIHRIAFTERLNKLGIPYGRKGDIVSTPTEPYSDVDFWRGVVDANGSLGLTGTGIPFIALVTASDSLADGYKDFIKNVTGFRPETNRNDRDDIYNIAVFKEKAQLLINSLYYRNCLCLDRKLDKAREAILWKRPKDMIVVGTCFNWTKDAEEYLISHSIRETMSFLGVGYNSVVTKRTKLRKAGIKVYDGK